MVRWQVCCVVALLSGTSHGGAKVTITPAALKSFYTKHAPKWIDHAEVILSQLDHGDLLIALKEKFGEGPETTADVATAKFVPDVAHQENVELMQEKVNAVKAKAEKLTSRRSVVEDEFLSTPPDKRANQNALLEALTEQVRRASAKVEAAEDELKDAIKLQEEDAEVSKLRLIAEAAAATKETASLKQVEADYERAKEYALQLEEKQLEEELKAIEEEEKKAARLQRAAKEGEL
jgi:hypothetical protein